MDRRFFKKFIPSLIATTLLVVAISSISVFADNSSISVTASSPNSTLKLVAVDDNDTTQSIVESKGVKSWITKKTLEALADGLRAGANNKYVRKVATDYLDSETAPIFLRNLGKIANKLDDIASIGNYAESYVRSQLWKLTKSITGEDSLSYAIADGVTAVLSWVLI